MWRRTENPTPHATNVLYMFSHGGRHGHRRARPCEPKVLGDILPEPGVMLVRCEAPGCGAVTALDIDADLHGYLSRASLNRLEDKLRCTCGGRRGRFETWPADLPAPSSRGRLYLFLI